MSASTPHREEQQGAHRLIVWLTLLLILLLTAFLRFWQLDTLPPGLYHDEAYNGLDALSLTQGKTFPQFYEGWELYAADAHAGNPALESQFPIFFEGNYGREPLHVYLMALSVGLFGATPFAVRFVPAAAGVLAVLTTFLAARALLGRRGHGGAVRRPATSEGHDHDLLTRFPNLVPLLAAFTMAILYPAVHFSRFGIRAMVFVPVETLAVFCFWQGVNRGIGAGVRGCRGAGVRGRRWDVWGWFLAAGFFLGLGIYTFAAARLLPLLWIMFVPLWFWLDRESLRQFWRQVLGMAAVALITAVPLLLFFWRYPYFFVFRIAFVANKGKGAVEGRPLLTWLFNVGRVLRGFFWLGETHLRHNLPGRPYLDSIQVVLFLLGLLSSLRRASWLARSGDRSERNFILSNTTRYVFLLLWWVVMLLPSILSGDAPHFGRLSGAAAPTAILVALGAVWLLKWVIQLFGRLGWSNRSTAVASLSVIAFLFLVSTGFTIRDYFGRYANHPDLARDFYLDDWQLGQYAAAQGEDTAVYLTPTQEELATIYYALQGPKRLRNYEGGLGAIPAGIPGQPALYLLRPFDNTTLQTLTNYFPDGEVGEEHSGFIPLLVTAATPRVQTANEIDHTFSDKIKLLGWSAETADGVLNVTLAWQALAPIGRDYTAFVHLFDNNDTLLTQLDRPPAGYPTADWQPGEIVIDTYAVPLPADWPTDGYSIETGFYYLPTLERLGEAVILE